MSQPLDIAALSQLFPQSSTYYTASSWHTLASAILLGFGREDHVVQLADASVQSAEDMDEEEQLNRLRKLRGAMLKASPLSINGLQALHTHLQTTHAALAARLSQGKSMRQSVSLEERRKRGRAFFDGLYAQHSERVLKGLDECSGGDLGEFAVSSVYGNLVAELSVLGAKETSLLEFLCCLTLWTRPQAKGHMYGARNMGNSGAEIVAATRLVADLAQQLSVP